MRAERIAWLDALIAGLGWGRKVRRGGAKHLIIPSSDYPHFGDRGPSGRGDAMFERSL